MGSLIKQCIFFNIFLQFSFPPPYTNLKLRKNSDYTYPTSGVRWGVEYVWIGKCRRNAKVSLRLLSMSEGLLLFITDAPIFWESFFIMQPSLTSTRTNSQFFGTCCASGMWRVMLSATFLHCRECLKKICYSTAAIIIRSTELNLGCFLALETIVD